MLDDLVDAFVNAGVQRVQDDIGERRGVICRAYAGKLGKFAAPRTPVQTFGIALFANIERGVDKYFDKGIGADDMPGVFSMLGFG